MTKIGKVLRCSDGPVLFLTSGVPNLSLDSFVIGQGNDFGGELDSDSWSDIFGIFIFALDEAMDKISFPDTGVARQYD